MYSLLPYQEKILKCQEKKNQEKYFISAYPEFRHPLKRCCVFFVLVQQKQTLCQVWKVLWEEWNFVTLHSIYF